MAPHKLQENATGSGCMPTPTPTPTPTSKEEEEEHGRGRGVDWQPATAKHQASPAACSPATGALPADGPEPSTKPLVSAKSLLWAAPARSATASAHEKDSRDVRSLSFSKLLSFRISRAPSSLSLRLDIDDSSSSVHQQPDELAAADAAAAKKTARKEQEARHICRSQSVPMSIKRLSSKGKGLKRVADWSSLANGNGAGEEEAVCRICMVALSEGSEAQTQTLIKLECWCKGELALAHRDCAVKWFSIKGNASCDVCNQQVLNLPVTLRSAAAAARHDPAAAAAAAASSIQQHGGGRHRAWQWHGTPILVMISMLAYFCFLEQLLLGDHGTAALAISLPFACVLGLFSSLTTTKMVSRRYVWIHSAVQFLFIVLFTHLFYRYVRMQAVIAIILSTFAGFGVAICGNAVILQIMRCRARESPEPEPEPQQQAAAERPPQQAPPASEADLETALPPP